MCKNGGGGKMGLGEIIMLLGLSWLSSITCKNTAIAEINRIGRNTPYYPKWYVLPAQWVRILFGLKNFKIPRYLYIELILSVFFAIIGPVSVIIGFTTNMNPNVMGILIMLQCALMIVRTLIITIMHIITRKR